MADRLDPTNLNKLLNGDTEGEVLLASRHLDFKERGMFIEKAL
jgi:hypothetical protein